MKKTATVQEIGLTNKINLCDSCKEEIPECGGENIIFGDGVGNDNIAACSEYNPMTKRQYVE